MFCNSLLRFFSFGSQWTKSVDSRDKPVQTLGQAYALLQPRIYHLLIVKRLLIRSKRRFYFVLFLQKYYSLLEICFAAAMAKSGSLLTLI